MAIDVFFKRGKKVWFWRAYKNGEVMIFVLGLGGKYFTRPK